jgi:hypothetical protein
MGRFFILHVNRFVVVNYRTCKQIVEFLYGIIDKA